MYKGGMKKEEVEDGVRTAERWCIADLQYELLLLQSARTLRWTCSSSLRTLGCT